MAAKLTRLTHNIVIQLPLVAESCTICSSRSRRPVRKLLDTPTYVNVTATLTSVQSHGLGIKVREFYVFPIATTHDLTSQDGRQTSTE
jgi:hypothetical protein